MAIPVSMIINLVTGLMAGPVAKILDAYVKDVELRRKLEAELNTQIIAHLGKEQALEQSIILAEINSDTWLTKTWRPILMLSLLGFLGFVGVLLPLADLMAGRALPFNPRWTALPEGFWDFLSVGVGGYIGGRSLEKIAAQAPLLKGRAK
jgi:Holin of 3TMs, for gene-transfer release